MVDAGWSQGLRGVRGPEGHGSIKLCCSAACLSRSSGGIEASQMAGVLQACLARRLLAFSEEQVLALLSPVRASCSQNVARCSHFGTNQRSRRAIAEAANSHPKLAKS